MCLKHIFQVKCDLKFSIVQQILLNAIIRVAGNFQHARNLKCRQFSSDIKNKSGGKKNEKKNLEKKKWPEGKKNPA